MSVNNTYTSEEQATLLEQYKICLQLSDKLSDRRLGMNNFYATLSAGLLGLLSQIYHNTWFSIIIGITGILIAINWIMTLTGYKQLNQAKFKVIDKIEQTLPYPAFAEEWVVLQEIKSNNATAWTKLALTDEEKRIPYFFLILFFIFLFYFVGKLVLEAL